MASSKKYLSFQAKVLIPVVTLLVVVLTITLWVVNRRLMNLLELDARRSLRTANVVFQNSLEIRARNLLLQYQNVVNEPRFKAVAQLGESKTMTVQLNELLEEMGNPVEAILFIDQNGRVLAGAKRDPLLALQEFRNISLVSSQEGLEGHPGAQIVAVRERLYNFLSVPVVISGTPVGLLSIGVRLDKTAAEELRSLTGDEIAFVVDNDIVASTLNASRFDRQLGVLFRNLTVPSAQQNGIGLPEDEVIASGGEHFLCLAQRFVGQNRNIGYLLLSSYENALLAKQGIQRMLLLISLFGILFSTLLIAVLIRRITNPLLELRNSAEAVGRGDFSHRVEITSNDECGDLAVVFNRMTENLTASRAETEQALERLRNAQAQLIQSEKLSAIGEFVAGVAHELNNPLTALIGFSEVLRLSGISERQENFVDHIVESSERCHKIVQGLLSFARQQPPERKWINIDQVIEAAVEILRYELRNSSIQVVTNFSPDLPRLLVDPHQLQQVFLNIINNARQAILDYQANGEIRIKGELIDKRVRLTFQDTGPGITPDVLRRIFDPFYTTKPVGVGTGLGLSLAYGIIREHGGTISAHSLPGEGTTLIIELPATDIEKAAPEKKSARASASILAKEGLGKKILIIDDEQPILDLLKAALTGRGYQVETVQDGKLGLHRAQQDQYDLIMCDWKIPGFNGQQIYEQLKKNRPDVIQKMIFMTGDILSKKAEQFLKEQNRLCIFKPFSIEELRETLRKSLKLTS